jgi:hypothetical protein
VRPWRVIGKAINRALEQNHPDLKIMVAPWVRRRDDTHGARVRDAVPRAPAAAPSLLRPVDRGQHPL